MKAAAFRTIVLDASVAVACCFEDESSSYSEGVLDLLSTGTEVLSPAIWPFEVANAPLVAERRRRIKMAQVTALLRRIAELPVSIEPIVPVPLLTRSSRLHVKITSSNTTRPTSNSRCAKGSR
jgi:predicted nucleic acid-binding protein